MQKTIVLSADGVHINKMITAYKTHNAIMQDLADLQHYLDIPIERR